MGKKKRVAAIMMMFLFAVVLFWKPNDVSAAARQVRLRANRTYKNYDITGNKKKDSIRVKTTQNSIALVVNGRTVYSTKAEQLGYGEADIRYCQFANGKPFLFIRGYGINAMTMSRILYYRSGKITAINMGGYFRNFGSIYDISGFRVSGNAFYVVFHSMPYSTGVTFLKPYKFVCSKKGAIVRAAYTFDVERFSHAWNSTSGEREFKAARNLTVYTNNSMKKKAYTIKKGQKVSIDKIYYNGKVMMLRTKYKGKYGWLKALTKSQYPKYKQFADTAFAG